jgi:TRADD-N domain-containing protein
MVNGSNTTSEQENSAKPLTETDPLKDEIEESEVTIAMLTGEILQTERRIGFYLYGILAIFGLVVFIVFWGTFHQKELLNALNLSSNNLYTYFLFGIIFAGIFLLVTLIYFGQRIFSAHATLASLKADKDLWTIKKRITWQFAAKLEKPSYFDSLVRINIENLAAFDVLVKVQADKSYKIAMRVCIFGFFLVIVGLILIVSNVSSPPIGSYITIASGIITEIIAGVFFSVYNRTIRQIRGFYDSLLTEQNILLSFKLMEDSKDENERAKIVSQMLTNLVNQQNSSFLSANKVERPRPATIK